MKNTNLSTPEAKEMQQGEIFEAIDSLGSAIGWGRELTDSLSFKLNPVMKPVPVVASVMEKLSDAEPETCQIICLLKNLRNVVRSDNDLKQELLDRVQL